MRTVKRARRTREHTVTAEQFFQAEQGFTLWSEAAEDACAYLDIDFPQTEYDYGIRRLRDMAAQALRNRNLDPTDRAEIRDAHGELGWA